MLPDLVHRAGALTQHEADRLLLSAHSQGSVIALATVLQLPAASARRTCLLTYGSPLTALYAAVFPGYVNRDTYRAAAARLGGTDLGGAGWPWRNLYRRTDPIGDWVLARPAAPAPPTSPTPSAVLGNGASVADSFDIPLVDPVFDRVPGDG